MTITLLQVGATPSNTPFRMGTKITKAIFMDEAVRQGMPGTPLFDGVADPIGMLADIYDLIVSRGHSAEVWLGIAGREHSWGRNSSSVLYRGNTRSWTNARSIRTPGMPGGVWNDPVRKSSYAIYRNVYDSVADGMYRIDDPSFSYAGAHSLADVIKVWAPAEDSNDPEGYAWWVLNYAQGLWGRMTPAIPGGDSPFIPWIPADSRHYTQGRTVAWPDLLVVHHTDGWDSLNWLTISPNSNVSATYLLNHDGTPRAQLVRHQDTPHTTGSLNPRTLTWEWERYWTNPAQRQHPQRVPDSTYKNIAKAIADAVIIERARGNPNFQGILKRNQIGPHNQWGNTTCPGNLDVNILYPLIVASMEGQLSPPPTDKPGMRLVPETGKYLYGGFKGLWEQLESLDQHLVYRTVGYPLSNEGWALVDGQKRRVQLFNKAAFIWNQGLTSPYDVTVMNLADYDSLSDFVEDPV
jgi:hypothetical protein